MLHFSGNGVSDLGPDLFTDWLDSIKMSSTLVICSRVSEGSRGLENSMKCCLWFLFGLMFLLVVPRLLAQDRPLPVALVQLIANPEDFDGKVVTVRGYLLMIGGHGDIGATFLNLSREDADNMLGNAIVVVASDQMRRDEEKIDRMYITLTGHFYAVPTANKSYIPTIKDVVSCAVWSDPNRPIGLKYNPPSHK
jgi:hypothetical protein